MLSAITFAVEDAEALEPELRPLLPSHMAEFEVYEWPLEPSPDFETYRMLSQSGRLVAFTARVRDQLVGYWLGVRFSDPHHTIAGRRAEVMMSQAHHIVPEWRAKVAPGFFRYIERGARERGIDLLAQRVRPGERSEGFMGAIGYKRAELVMAKQLSMTTGV